MSAREVTTERLSAGLRRLVRLRVWLGGRLRLPDWQAAFLWAVAAGFAGAWIACGFREASDWLHSVFTGSHGGIVASFAAMPGWRRLLVPTAGGLLAGLVLYYGGRRKGRGNSTDYMEAVVVGNGVLSVRASLVKSVSAWFSTSSGASIGREGPIVQLASLGASLMGRVMGFSLPQRRQLVACGAAAGIASAYNAPIAGAFFVSEIVLGSVAAETFGPLLVASATSALVTRSIYGNTALYELAGAGFSSPRELVPYLLLGAASGVLAAGFLGFLKWCERFFSRWKLPSWARLACGGLIVGLMTLTHPEVAGNGRSLVDGMLHHPGAWMTVAALLVFKIAATGATFGSGAVGGVFTPTLFTGSAFGYLFGLGAVALLPSWGLEPRAFGLVGMGALLAACTGAPVMAIVMLFELTLNYQLVIPAALAGMAAYHACRSLTSRSLYADALLRKGAGVVARHLAQTGVRELVRPDKGALSAGATFRDVAVGFLHSRSDFLHVQEDGRYLGAIALEDITGFLTEEEDLAALIIAKDLVRETHPRLVSGCTLAEAMEAFAACGLERLPVTDGQSALLGVVTRSDLLLFVAGKPRPPAA